MSNLFKERHSTKTMATNMLERYRRVGYELLNYGEFTELRFPIRKQKPVLRVCNSANSLLFMKSFKRLKLLWDFQFVVLQESGTQADHSIFVHVY